MHLFFFAKTVCHTSVKVPHLLLMALVAASSATAGRAVGVEQEADGQYCAPVRICTEDQCSATCAVLGIPAVGQCKVK